MENGPILHFLFSISALCQKVKYLPGLRVPQCLRLLEDRRSVAMHLEASPARRHQLHVDARILGANLGRQTDGPGFVVSKGAILDRDRHGRL